MYCLYYHVTIPRTMIWFVVGHFRSEDNIAFERALDGSPNVLEFFVPEGNQDIFLANIASLRERGMVTAIEALPNRLMRL